MTDMKFTSITFALFFIIVYILYWNIKGRSKLSILLIASICFYSAWSPYFGIHFVLIALSNFFLVTKLYDTRSRSTLISILFLNAGNLFFFKYFYLFLDSLLRITGSEFFEKEVFDSFLYSMTGSPSILLPLAISFYSFVFIAYAVDVYNGKINEKEKFLEYMTFIFYFPHLVAGPIIRHSDFFYQLKNRILPSPEKITQGMYLIIQGLFKKIVVADNASQLILPIYSNPSNYDWTSAWMAVLGYSVRAFCDFSGYTDIARGLSKLLGLELPENFRAPFLTTNVRTLWRKWHYTLATWIRDYIYIPLGGSRQSELRNSINAIVAFTLGGLWHGANYTFIAWGLWNGIMIAVERRLSIILPFLEIDLKKGEDFKGKIRYYVYLVLGILFTTWVWLIGLSFFNSESINIAWDLILRLHTFQSGEIAKGWETIVYMLVITYFFNYLQKIGWEGFPPTWKGNLGLFGFGIFTMLMLGLFTPEGADFIYFQF